MNNLQKHTKEIVLIAMLTATLSGGKFALSFLPNIEIVTLLLVTYSFVFGLKISLPCSLLFVTIDSFIYGFNTWVISYFIYWPLLCVFGYLISNLRVGKNTGVFALTVIMTAFFGVLTSFVDALIGAINLSYSFLTLFKIIYLRGIAFYVVHLFSNTIIYLLCFLPLSSALQKLKSQYFSLPTTNTKPQ